MKFLFVLVFIMPSILLANWIAESELKNPLNIFPLKRVCEAQKSEKCFLKKQDMRRWKAGFRAVDIKKTFDCNGSAVCQQALDNGEFSCLDGESPIFDDKENWPDLDFNIEGRPGSGWFLWCQKEQLIEDAAGIISADAEDTQKASDNSARVMAKVQRDLNLDQCVADSKSATLSLPQASSCIRALVRELMGENIPISDL